MKLNPKTLTRACIVSLAGFVPAVPTVAAQLHSPTVQVVPSDKPTHSILEPIMVGTASQQQSAANAAGTGQTEEREAPRVAHVGSSPLAMFQQVDAIASAAVTSSNSLVPVGFQSEAEPVDAAAGTSNRVQASQAVVGAGVSNSGLVAEPSFRTSQPVSGQPIVVHPPTTRPAAPNRNYFLIENTSSFAAKNVVIQLRAPAGATVMEVFPYDTIVEGQTACYRFNEIPAGQTVTVELTTTPDTPTQIAFDSRCTMDPMQRLARRAAAVPSAAQAIESPSQPGTIPAKKASFPAERNEPTVAPPANAGRTPDTRFAEPLDMKVRSGAAARKAWQNDSRLNYGSAAAPGPVRVANPNAVGASSRIVNNSDAAAPFPRTPSAVNLDERVEDEVVDQVPSANGSTAPAIDSDAIEQQVAASRVTPDGVKWTSQLRTRIDGPQHAVTGEEAEYEVVVENNSIKDAKEVIVQLAIPVGLEVTVLDRNAWFDGKARTITWKLPTVDAGQSETIRYLAKVTSPIGQLQKVTLGVENKFRGQATFQSTVMDQYELAAPLMSFEKDAKSLK